MLARARIATQGQHARGAIERAAQLQLALVGLRIAPYRRWVTRLGVDGHALVAGVDLEVDAVIETVDAAVGQAQHVLIGGDADALPAGALVVGDGAPGARLAGDDPGAGE